MRLLRLDLPTRSLELHPYLTVVRGLPPEERQLLVDAVVGLPAGRAVCRGVVEAHGVLLDLDDDTLALLDLQEARDVVVRAEQVPGAETPAPLDPDVAASSAVRSEAALAEAERELEATERMAAAAREALAEAEAGVPGAQLPETTAELAQLRIDRADAEQAVERARVRRETAHRRLLEAEQAAASARRERADAARELATAQAALADVSEQRDPLAVAALDAARQRLTAAEAALASMRAGALFDPGDADEAAAGAAPAAATVEDGATDPAAEIARLSAQRSDVEARLVALDASDPLPVRLALDQLLAAGPVELVPLPEALALADRWHQLDLVMAERAVDDDPDDDHLGGDLTVLTTDRVEAAEREVAAAELAMAGLYGDPVDVAEVEARHAEVLAARENVGRRFGGGRAAERVRQAERAEAEALGRLGFATYADFQIAGGRADSTAVREASARLDRARQELAVAERARREHQATLGLELERAELVEQRRALRVAAVAILGSDPGEDVSGALRRHRVPLSDTGGHLARLRAALERTGLDLADEDVEEQFLTDLANVWLREQHDVGEQRERLVRELADIDDRLATLRRGRVDAGGRDAALAEALAAAEDARTAVGAAQSRLNQHAAAERELDRARVALEAAGAREDAAVAALVAAEEEVATATADARAAATEVANAIAAVRLAAEAEADAAALLVELQNRVHHRDQAALRELREAVRRAEAMVQEARRTVIVRRGVAEAARSGAAIVAAAGGRRGPGPRLAPGATDDAEWYLLSRLAAQRSVTFAGSLPIVLDDALRELPATAAAALLTRVERMASTVQVLLLTDDLSVATWASELGIERAVVV